MANCKSCGSVLPENANNCPNCGAQVTTASDAINNAANAIGEQYKKIEGADTTAQYDQAELKENKVIFVLAYLWILFFLPLVACPDSKAGKFHANQGLLLLITGIILGVACSILGACLAFIPFGWIITSIVSSVVGLFTLILAIIGIVNVINNRVVELPLIGKINLINK